MTFGEKVKMLRMEHGWTLRELAERIGVSSRTIVSYESGTSYPKSRSTYDRLAEVLNVDVNFLRTENEEFMSEVAAQYGSRGLLQARNILEQTRSLFAGGMLSEEDELAFMHELQDIFFESKKISSKFTPKKYRRKSPQK